MTCAKEGRPQLLHLKGIRMLQGNSNQSLGLIGDLSSHGSLWGTVLGLQGPPSKTRHSKTDCHMTGPVAPGFQPPQASGCSISRVPIQTPFGVGPLHQQPALSLHMWLSQGNFASFKLAHLCLVLDKQENQPPRRDQLLQTCMRNARVQQGGESINIGTLPKAGKALGKRTLAVHSTLPEENCTLCRSLIRTGIMHARCLAYLTRITAYQQSVYLF